MMGDAANSVRDFLSSGDTAQSDADKVHIESMIALALATKGEKEQALYWAVCAVDQDSRNAEGHHTLGLACEVCGFLNLAIESLQRAIELQPPRWESVRVLGTCQRESGRVQDAIQTLSRYVANNPDDPWGMYELAWSLHVYPVGDNLEKAEQLYERALGKNPDQLIRTIVERKLRDIRGETA